MNLETIKLIKPAISFFDVLPELESIFSSGNFSSGKYNKALQNKIKNYIGCKEVSLTTSATTALWLCLKLLNIKTNDKVLISDFSYPATANVVEDLGAIPILVDVNSETFNSDAKTFEKLISKEVKAIIFVDSLGNPSGLTEVSNLCKTFNLPLIEDAACAFGSVEGKKLCGNLADLTCFSFHPRKLICAGEGGSITTNNSKWGDWLNIKLSHGRTLEKSLIPEFETFGYNFRLSEIQAALCGNQINNLDNLIDIRRKIFEYYRQNLNKLGFKEQKVNANSKTNYQTLAFKVPKDCSRNSLIKYLKSNNIESTIGTYSISNIKYYREKYNYSNNVSKNLMDTTIALPCFEGIDAQRVVDTIKNYF